MNIIDNKIGKLFPPATSFAGYVFLAIGVLLLFGSPILGVPLILIGGLISVSTTGIRLKPETKEYKEYKNFFGLKTGDWKSFKDYPDLAVLKKNISTTAYSRANRPGLTSKNTFFDLCLLDSSHRFKIIVKRFENPEDAKREAPVLADELSVRFTNYKPKVSNKTRARRRGN